MLAQELGKLPYKISIEGHTDSKPFAERAAYGNWELSADRANAARRLMQEVGLPPTRCHRSAALPTSGFESPTSRSTPRIAGFR